MSEHRFTTRLDDRYEDDHRAWAKLNDIQRRTHRSFSKIVADAVNRYDNEHLHLTPDGEEQLVHKITDAVAERLQLLLPAYLAGYSAALGGGCSSNGKRSKQGCLQSDTPERAGGHRVRNAGFR